jgi:curved DNA-binding protein CbpA
MNDLYSTLGVKPDSTKEEIKESYRNLAKESHPDKKTGNTEKFQELQLAYSILGNDEKRKRYDETGSTGKVGFDSTLSAYIGGILEEIIKSGKDVDVIHIVKEVTRTNIINFNHQLTEINKQEEKVKKVIGRIKIKKGVDLFTPILEGKLKIIEQQKNLIREERKTMEQILEVLNGYEYDYTPQFTNSNIGGFFFTQ